MELLTFTIVFVLLCILVSYLIKAIDFQHSSLKARQLSQHIYDKAMDEFFDCSISVFYSTKDCRNDSEKRIISKLKQAAEINHCDVMVLIITSDKHHLTVIKQSKKLLNVVMTTATMDDYKPDNLSHIISCMMVLHDMSSANVLNSSEEEYPTTGFVPITTLSPFVTALTIYSEASRKLKEVDQLFKFSGSKNVNTRAGKLQNILARENEENFK